MRQSYLLAKLATVVQRGDFLTDAELQCGLQSLRPCLQTHCVISAATVLYG